MRHFGQTGKIVVKADRDVDPYQHIDHLRQQAYELGEEQEKIWAQINALRNSVSNKRDWTESGVWRVVKEKLEEETIDWVKWGVRAALAGLGTAFLAVMAWLLRLAWQGLRG